MALSLPATLEAVLFADGGPMQKKRLATFLGIDEVMLAAGLSELSAQLANRGLALIETATEVELRTSPDAAPIIEKLRQSELSRDLGKASLETLAIIIYQGGATRSEVDWVRGVNSTAALRSLLLRGLIDRSEDTTDRRRARYTATIDALAHLGIRSPEELPRYGELAGNLGQAVATQPDATTSQESSTNSEPV
jgi:segregation and condensation protein B